LQSFFTTYSVNQHQGISMREVTPRRAERNSDIHGNRWSAGDL